MCGGCFLFQIKAFSNRILQAVVKNKWWSCTDEKCLLCLCLVAGCFTLGTLCLAAWMSMCVWASMFQHHGIVLLVQWVWEWKLMSLGVLIPNSQWYLHLLPMIQHNILRGGGRQAFLLCPLPSSFLLPSLFIYKPLNLPLWRRGHPRALHPHHNWFNWLEELPLRQL